MTPTQYREAAQFVKSLLEGNWNDAGAFADWLEEHGDKRGVLLRRRWKRWQKEAAAESDALRKREAEIVNPLLKALSDLKLAGWDVAGSVHATITDTNSEAARTFGNYIREKFSVEWTWIPMDTNSQAYLDS